MSTMQVLGDVLDRHARERGAALAVRGALSAMASWCAQGRRPRLRQSKGQYGDGPAVAVSLEAAVVLSGAQNPVPLR